MRKVDRGILYLVGRSILVNGAFVPYNLLGIVCALCLT